MHKNPKAIEYITGKNKVLEWGSGESTLHWMKVVNIFVSIEHKYEWYNKIAPNVSDNVEYHLVPSHSLKDDDELEQYVLNDELEINIEYPVDKYPNKVKSINKPLYI